jgi:hypothetical protein
MDAPARHGLRETMHTTLSSTRKVRGGIISQANRYLGGCCSAQRIFPPQIIQVLLLGQPRLLGNTAHTLPAILTKTLENSEAFLPKSHVGRLSEG